MGKRVGVVGSLVAMFMLHLGGVAAQTGSAVKASPPTAPVPPIQHHVIGVYGDSLADGTWSGLYFLVKSHPQDSLFRRAKVGTGLTTPDFPGWLQDFTSSLDADHVTQAVIMFGANDQQSIRDEKRTGFLFKTPGWTRVYGARVNAVLAETARRHIQTLWIGLPIMRSDDLNAGAVFLNDLYAKAAADGGATFVPLIDTFKGPDGKFATHLPDAKGQLRSIRADDGVHFTPYGYQIIGSKVYDVIGGNPPPPAK